MASRSSGKFYTYQELESTIEIDVIGSTTIERRTYPVLRLLLINFAPGFASTFKNPDADALRVRNVSYKTFEIFLSWLCMEYFRHKGTNKDLWCGFDGHPTWIASLPEYHHGYGKGLDPLWWHFEGNHMLWGHAEVMLEVHFFAKRWNIPLLREDAIHRLIWCHNTACFSEMLGSYIPAAAVAHAWKYTKPGDVLRKVLVRGWLEFKFDKDNLGEAIADLPMEMFKDMYECLVVFEGQGHMIDGCEFHEHATILDDIDCPSRIYDMCPT